MEFFRKQTKIDFLSYRNIAAAFSVLLMVGSIAILMTKGLNWGLDFTGGTVIELGYQKPAELPLIRSQLHAHGFDDAVVQNYGSNTNVAVRVAPRTGLSEQQVAKKILAVLHDNDPTVELKKTDAVGAQVGKEMTEKGAMAVFTAMVLTALYIAFRFEYRFAVGAAVALAHDPILILGIFSLTQVEFDLQTLAAMLAVIGYSLNDTIVVFDRVKENFIKIRKASPVEVMNKSLNQTLSRTIMTSFLTLLVVVALLLFGGPSIFGFALALLIGVVIGTYSSIYIAGSIAISMGLSKQDLMPPARQEADGMP